MLLLFIALLTINPVHVWRYDPPLCCPSGSLAPRMPYRLRSRIQVAPKSAIVEPVLLERFLDAPRHTQCAPGLCQTTEVLVCCGDLE